MALLALLAEIHTLSPPQPPPSSPPLPPPDPTVAATLQRTRGRAHSRYQSHLPPEVLLATGAAWASEVLIGSPPPDLECAVWLEILQAHAAQPAAPEVALPLALRHPPEVLEGETLRLLGARLIPALRGRLATQVEHRVLALLLRLAPEHAVGTLGFSTRGARHFTYGPRTLDLHLEADNTLALSWQGQRLQRLSTNLKDADTQELYAQRDALDRLAYLAGALPGAFAAEWLEPQILTGAAWPWSTWRALLVDSPLLRPLAAGLVLQEVATDHLRLLTDEGELIDETLGVVAPTADTLLRLPHPATLAPSVVAVWQALQQEAAPLVRVAHLDRPAGVLPPPDAAPRLPVGTLEAGRLVRHLVARGWAVEPPSWQQGRPRCLALLRELPGGWQIRLRHSGHYPVVERLNERDLVDLIEITATQDGQPIPWPAVPPLLRAELQAALVLTAAPSAPASPRVRKVVRRKTAI